MSLQAFKESLQTSRARGKTHAAAATTKPIEAEPAAQREPPKSSLQDQFAAFNRFLKPCIQSAPAAQDGDSRTKRSFSVDVGLQRCTEDAEERMRKRRKVDDDFEPAKEEDDDFEPVKEEEDVPPLHDSEAGLFIQSEREGPYEPLVLSSASSSSTTHGRVVQVPASINSRLLPHQRDGVQFLYSLYRENRGGILGDDMGLGKTIQTIAFIAALLDRDCEVGALNSVRSGAANKGSVVPPSKVFLILCPTSVLRNWEQEFQAWGSFRVGIYHGVNRDAILDKVHTHELEVVLTSHDMFRLNLTALCNIKWDCVIVDEAHRLKNDKSQLYKACIQMKTKRRYGLTGTIMQNNYNEMFNVFDWAAPGSLGPREHFKEYYGEPLKQGQRISAPERFVKIAEERKQHLVKVLSRHLLRRTKEGTIGHLMRGKADNVVFCKMSDVQTRVYRRLLRSPDFQLLISKDAPCSCGSHLTRVECCHRTAPDGVIWSYLHQDDPDGCDWCPFCIVLPCLTKLQQVSNHLELMKPSPKDDPEKQKRDEQFATAALGEDAVLVGGVQQDESFMGLSDAQHCGKMRALEKLLATWLTKGDKVLLFSYSVKMLDILDRFMVRKAYSFSRLDGSTPMGLRQTLVDEFNNSPSKQVFLISTRAGGLGLNLVSANRVVIFDPNWNPAQDLQAQDRTFRYGQRRHVTVYRLLAAGSIEELVYSRQIYKQQLFNIGVNGTFEKRYFEGVQDSKIHKGELFGISNLFRDLSETVFTSDIIEKHDERITGIHRSSSGAVVEGSNKSIVRIEEADFEDISNSSRDEIEDSDATEVISDSGDEIENSESQCDHLLKDAGVLYTHRNEQVVGVPQSRGKVPKMKVHRGGDGASSSGVVNQQQKEASTSSSGGFNRQQKEASTSGSGGFNRQQKEVSISDEVHRTRVETNSEQQESEPQKYGEMDAMSKWLLAASGFSSELIDSLSHM